MTSAGTMTFSSGDVVVRREVRHGHVHAGLGVRIVRDTADLVAMFLSGGSELGFAEAPVGSRPPYYSPSGRHPWDRGPGTLWQGAGVLMLQRPGEAHAVWVFQGDDVDGWYVNLQDPLTRTPIGFDTFDHELDVVVSSDLDWRFKDADAMPSTVELGRFTQQELDAVWAEGHRVTRDLDAGTAWWTQGPDDWAAWRAPEAWQVGLALPAGWRDVRVTAGPTP